MKERKPLFPEYIWMFFVGLLLAIIVCMRLLPGHAETVNPVYGNSNVFTWESLQNSSSVFQAPFNTSGWINSEGNIYLDASVYRSDNSGASFYGPMIDYEYVALQNPIIYGQIGASYSGTDLITVSSNNNNGPVSVEAIPSSLYYSFFEHGYSYFACDLWCFPWQSWSNNPVNIGYAIVKMTSGSVPTVYKRTGLADYQLFQVELDDSNIVDMMFYWNQNIDYFDGGITSPFQNVWVNFEGATSPSAFVFTNPEVNEESKLFISTVYMGNFNFQHTGDWNEQYSKNYKYRITVDSRYFEVEASASPTPSPEPVTENYNFIFYNLNVWNNIPYYWLVSFDAENFGKDISVSSTPSAMFSGVVSDLDLSFPVSLSGSTFSFHDQTNYDYLTLYFTADSISNVVYYNLGSSLISQDYDILKETYSAVSFGSGNSKFSYLEDPLISGVFGFMLDDGTYKSDTLISYSFDYTYQSVGNFNSLYTALFTSDYYTNSLTYYGYSGLLGSGTDVTPTPSPTPEGWQPTSTPTATPVPETVVVILPSPTPGPTAPVSFSGSDLPGGGAGGIDGTSGNAGSISTNGGASPSTANGVYNYWSTVLSQNQALAFIASFFQILPFDLVYALGSLIFILILLAMARLFIHFIE